MNPTRAILLQLLSSGPIHGRTMLQKRMYFYSVLSEQDFGFRPHYYGPYSSRVSAHLDGLVAAGVLTDTRRPTGGVTAFGEVVRHDYSLKSSEAVEEWREEPESERAISLFQQIADHPVARDANMLSAAAKVHLIVSSGGTMTIAKVEQKARDLGWDLNSSEIKQVLEYLKALNLVAVRKGK